MSIKKKFPHYHMCAACATAKGGVMEEGHCCTVMRGTCEYCGAADVTLIPWVDFNWPKENKQINLTAALGRD